MKKNNNTYTLTQITRNGKAIKDNEIFTVTCLATQKYMAAILSNENHSFKCEDMYVKDTWVEHIKNDGNVLSEPTHYITLR